MLEITSKKNKGKTMNNSVIIRFDDQNSCECYFNRFRGQPRGSNRIQLANYEEIESLEKQLAKAESVIRFYGNCEQWITDKVGHPRFCKLDEDLETIGDQVFAGKMARDYFKEKGI